MRTSIEEFDRTPLKSVVRNMKSIQTQKSKDVKYNIRTVIEISILICFIITVVSMAIAISDLKDLNAELDTKLSALETQSTTTNCDGCVSDEFCIAKGSGEWLPHTFATTFCPNENFLTDCRPKKTENSACRYSEECNGQLKCTSGFCGGPQANAAVTKSWYLYIIGITSVLGTLFSGVYFVDKVIVDII